MMDLFGTVAGLEPAIQTALNIALNRAAISLNCDAGKSALFLANKASHGLPSGQAVVLIETLLEDSVDISSRAARVRLATALGLQASAVEREHQAWLRGAPVEGQSRSSGSEPRRLTMPKLSLSHLLPKSIDLTALAAIPGLGFLAGKVKANRRVTVATGTILSAPAVFGVVAAANDLPSEVFPVDPLFLGNSGHLATTIDGKLVSLPLAGIAPLDECVKSDNVLCGVPTDAHWQTLTGPMDCRRIGWLITGYSYQCVVDAIGFDRSQGAKGRFFAHDTDYASEIVSIGAAKATAKLPVAPIWTWQDPGTPARIADRQAKFDATAPGDVAGRRANALAAIGAAPPIVPATPPAPPPEPDPDPMENLANIPTLDDATALAMIVKGWPNQYAPISNYLVRTNCSAVQSAKSTFDHDALIHDAAVALKARQFETRYQKSADVKLAYDYTKENFQLDFPRGRMSWPSRSQCADLGEIDYINILYRSKVSPFAISMPRAEAKEWMASTIDRAGSTPVTFVFDTFDRPDGFTLHARLIGGVVWRDTARHEVLATFGAVSPAAVN